MINKLISILSGPERKEESPAELPEVRPFEGMEAGQAPLPVHKPDHVKKDINHAGHMRVVARSDGEAASMEAEALKLTRDKMTITYGEGPVSAYLSNFPRLKFLTITKNGETVCTFPLFSVGRPIGARITEITECTNGCEGQLEVYTNGSVVAFFDTLYFKNKNAYYPGKDVRVLLSGIAYVLTRVKGVAASNKKSPGHGAPDHDHLAFRYENGDVDDYVFRGRVEEAHEFSVLGKKAQAIKVPLRTGADSAIDVFVCVTENAMKEKLHKGDYVSGIMWLQGFVL